jgi:hypothetical protein
MKLHDGTERALPTICVSLLAELGFGSAPPQLEKHVRPAIHNHRKLVTGEIRATLRLKKLR